MGKALRTEHISFFISRMNEHDRVICWEPITNQDEFLFRIRRTINDSESDVIVHLTDAYRYGLAEFFARPKELRAGSYVVIGMPHADADPETIEEAKKHRIGIGHIGKFMGALNRKNMWQYMTAGRAETERAGTTAQMSGSEEFEKRIEHLTRKGSSKDSPCPT